LPLRGVLAKVVHEGGGDRLPPDGSAFLPEEDQALLRVEVLWAEGQGATAAAGGLDVQP
jgi:hypothetical protein